MKDNFNDYFDDEDNNEVKEEKQSFNKITKEDQNGYSDVIMKGFIWVIMFIVSIGALFIIFKDDAFSSKDKDITVVKNDDNTLKNSDDNYIENYNGDAQANSDNSDQYNFVNPDEDSKKADKDSSLNSDDSLEASDSSKKIDNSKEPAIVSKKEKSQQEDDEMSNIIKQNSMNTTSDGKPGEAEDSKVDQGVEKREMDRNAHVSLNNSAQRDENANIAPESSGITGSKTARSDALKNNPPKVAALTGDTFWVVNIYSTSTKQKAQSKWVSLSKAHKDVLIDVKAYFIKADIPNKGSVYRISLGDTLNNRNYPSFKDKTAANKYCSYLKKNKIDCFINSINKKELQNQNK